MYTSFSIENFRLFDQLTVEPLAHVNLIAGQNNIGKTALLEALWLHSLPNPRSIQRLGFWRGMSNTESEKLFSDLFRRYDTEVTVKTLAKDEWVRRRGSQQSIPFESTFDTFLNIRCAGLDDEVVFEFGQVGASTAFEARVWREEELDEERNRIRYRLRVEGDLSNQHFGPCVFVPAGRQPSANELSVKLGQSEISGYLDQVIDVLQTLEPHLRRLTAVPQTDGPVQIYADIGVGRIIPVSVMGDGFRRLLNLALSFHDASDGAIFIDEFENGIHYSAHKSVWKALTQFSEQFNVQLFATTHSYECIVAANDAFTEMESAELHLHRLYRRDERVKVQTYTKAALDTNIEYLWELR